MGLLERFLLPPTVSHLPVLPLLAFLLLLLLLTFCGVLLVVSALALATQKSRPGLSRLCLGLVSPKLAVWLAWGFLPGLTVALVWLQQLDGAILPVGDYLTRTLGLTWLALALLFAYRRTHQILIGLAGHLTLALALFCTLALHSLLTFPEKWPVIHAPLPPVFSWNVIAHFALYSSMFALLTGAYLLFVCFRWEEQKLLAEAAFRKEMRWLGQGLVLFGALSSPVLLLWHLLTAPPTGLAIPVFVAALVALLLLFLVATLSMWLAPERSPRWIGPLFALAVAAFGAVLFQDQAVLAVANEDLHREAAHNADARRQQAQQDQEMRYPKIVADLALGQDLFQKRCSACHRFDSRLVGPAYAAVIPKYRDRAEALKAFIRNPVKVDPAFPPMPAQGLTLLEVESIAAYLLQHFSPSTQGGKP